MSPTSRLQMCRAEEAATKRAFQELEARSHITAHELDGQIAYLRARREEHPSEQNSRLIRNLKKTICEHMEYYNEAEKNLKVVHESARALVLQTEKNLMGEFVLMSQAEMVKNFEKGEINYELFRFSSNITKLINAYDTVAISKPCPQPEIILTVSEEIIAGKYGTPCEGELWNDWLAAFTR